jgi:RsiW-degrading membrane proteinase PrsW (M82 family)
MNLSVLIVPVVLPVLFWAWYHYSKDRRLPEPIPLLMLAFALGVVAFGIGKLSYLALGFVGLRHDAFDLATTDKTALLLYAVAAIGPIEEIAKLIPFLVVIRRLPTFDEPIDGIIYASFIALGFAATENVVYFQYLTSGEALARGFVGPVVHIVFASIWGYHIGRAHLAGRGVAITAIVAVGCTALLHGIYDYLVIALPVFALPLSAALVIALWIWRMILLRRLARPPP